VLILSGDDYNALVSMDDCIAAVEEAFRQHFEGRLSAGILSAHAERGAFHIKTSLNARYFAAKLNANFPGNAPLPTIQGLLILFDASNGTPLAVMDSIELTKQRTAAASAVAAKYLARRDSRSVMIYGCGAQASAQLAAMKRVLRIERVNAVDVDAARAAAFAKRHDARIGIATADVVITCTTSKKPFLRDLEPGTFVAAVGADNPEKSEIDPEAMRNAVVVADVLEQCAAIGDLRSAIAAGAMSRDDVRAELGAIIAGRAAGRRGDDEIIIFDSTGAGFQDAAAAAIAYERAIEQGRGTRI
jgi:ornithine cyclodeaminase/alanine dehydrogenase-like protein (mu-crystallin family)